ncbi:MAG: tetratricopeptide repeat protein [Vicinamibacterales bacterium]|nr:tetratricopeptide repeat protein [Vicinamibacterales bacterium]
MLDALRQNNGTSLGPDGVQRRNSTEENVLASLGYPAQMTARSDSSPVFRILLAVAVVVVVAAILWQVAAMSGLVPKGVFNGLFGTSTAPAAVTSARPPQSPAPVRETAPPAAAPELAVPPAAAAAAPVEKPVPAPATPPATPAAAPRKAAPGSGAQAPANRSSAARTRTPRPTPAPVAPSPAPVTPMPVATARTTPAPAGAGLMPRGASKVPAIYRTETGEVDHWKLALYYHRNGDFENALVQYRAVLETNELNAEAQNNLGLLYLDKHLYDEATQAFRRATFIDPRYFKAHNNLGIALLKSGNVDAAVSEFRWIVAQDARNLEALTNLALALKAGSRLEESREILQRAITTNARYAPAHYNLALVYEESGDLMRAIQHYETFLSVNTTENAGLAAEVRARVQTLKAKLL